MALLHYLRDAWGPSTAGDRSDLAGLKWGSPQSVRRMRRRGVEFTYYCWSGLSSPHYMLQSMIVRFSDCSQRPSPEEMGRRARTYICSLKRPYDLQTPIFPMEPATDNSADLNRREYGIDQARNTILAALRYYQRAGQGDPKNRCDDIHQIATNSGQNVSLNAVAIDGICDDLNTGALELTQPEAPDANATHCGSSATSGNDSQAGA